MENGRSISRKKCKPGRRILAITSIAILSLLVIAGISLVIAIRAPGILPKRALSAEHLDECLRARIQPGDILLQTGIGITGDLIVLALAEETPFSHIGVVSWYNDTLGVIHTVNSTFEGINGAQFHPLDDFVAKARAGSLSVYRPHWGDESQLLRFLDYMRLALLEELPFDNAYDWEDDSAMYCSELVAKALGDAGFWNASESLLFKNRIILFSSFIQEELFEIINLAEVDN